MKKILLFIDNLGSGGAQRQLVNLGILLKEKGYSVSMLLYSDIPFYKKYLDNNQIPIILLESKNKIGRILRIRRFLKKSDADVVIAFLETPGFIACFSKMGGARWKLITNELSAKASTFETRKNRIFNWFERYSNAKVCNSDNAMRLWERYYPQYKEKYRVIYNPVMIPEKYIEGQPVTMPTEKFCLTVAASYQELKNPLRVLEAIASLSDEYKNRLKLQWYGRAEVETGNSEIYHKANAVLKEYHLENCVQLNTETSDIYKIMSESDAIGLFSTVEGLPNAICEGMMLGKPIIMSKVSDYKILTEGNGFLCDAYSVESIKETLMQLLDSSPEKLKEMGALSKAKAMELFSKEKITEQWIQLIESE